MKELITYYILLVILLMTLFSVGGAGLAVFSEGSVPGFIGVVVASLPVVLWLWWLTYVMKGCAGKNNWIAPN
jgi:hypothetical protein